MIDRSTRPPRRRTRRSGPLLVIFSAVMLAGVYPFKVTMSEELTVGVVQREIRVGMSGADVVEALGSPNIVSSDSDRREVWIYDKISRTTVSDAKKVEGSLVIIGGSSRSSTRTTTQKNLTIIIKFDKNSLVRDFSYRQASF